MAGLLDDIYIEDVEHSDLTLDPQESMAYHQFQQKRSYPGSNRVEIKSIPFNTGINFGDSPECLIPAMNILPHRMLVEFSVSAESTVTGAKFFPTSTWITDAKESAQLLFNQKAIYSTNSAALQCAEQLDQDPKDWLSSQEYLGYNLAADTADTANKYYLDLTPMCENVLARVGSLGVFSSNAWSVRLLLKAANLCMGNSTTAESPDATITGMNLIFIGSLVPPGASAAARFAIDQGGIVWNFLRPSMYNFNMADNAGSSTDYTWQMLSEVGAISRTRVVIRDKGKLEATTVSTKNNVAYQKYDGASDYIQIGTVENPTLVHGKQLVQKLVRNFQQMNSSKGKSRYLNGASTVAVLDNGIFDINFSELWDGEFGLSSGSVAIRNNYQLILTCATDTVQDNRVDVINYMHSKALINAGGFNINPSA